MYCNRSLKAKIRATVENVGKNLIQIMAEQKPVKQLIHLRESTRIVKLHPRIGCMATK